MTAATFEERLQAIDARLQHVQIQADERIEKLEQERDEYKKLAAVLQEQVERLKRGLVGQKAERLPKNDGIRFMPPCSEGEHARSEWGA